MTLRRRLPALIVLALVVAPLDCRRATGVVEDQLDREAKSALVAYLRIDTSNPPGNETAGATFLQQLLVHDGIEAQLVGADPSRQGVYARLRSGSREKALLLLHHIDVVPAAESEWTKQPFGGAESEGYIWGRGALDVKSLGIAQAMALIELKRRNAKLKRDVVFLAVPDEEAGGMRGCAELLEKRPELFENVGYVLNEGGYSETIVDHVAFWGIEVQQKVPLWLRVHAKGAAGHAAVPPDDGGTVGKLIRALAAIQGISTSYRVVPEVERAFRAAGAARRDERGRVLRHISTEIGNPRLERLLPYSYRALLHDTIVITRIQGGTTVNSIPATATGEVDIRLLPDESPQPMLDRVRAAAGSDVEVETLIAGKPADPSPADTDLFRLIAGIMTSDQPGSTVGPVVGAGATDSRFFRARGLVAYGVTPFKVNYYDAGTVHGNDERIRARFFTDGVRLMRRIVAGFCAVSP